MSLSTCQHPPTVETASEPDMYPAHRYPVHKQSDGISHYTSSLSVAGQGRTLT